MSKKDDNNHQFYREIISFLTGIAGIIMGIILVIHGTIITFKGYHYSTRSNVLQDYGEYKHFVGGTLILLGLLMIYKLLGAFKKN